MPDVRRITGVPAFWAQVSQRSGHSVLGSVLPSTVRTEDGDKEKLLTTGSHKFYSAYRDAWLSAEDLEIGELL